MNEKMNKILKLIDEQKREQQKQKDQLEMELERVTKEQKEANEQLSYYESPMRRTLQLN